MIPLVAINQLAALYRGRGKDEAYLEFTQACTGRGRATPTAPPSCERPAAA